MKKNKKIKEAQKQASLKPVQQPKKTVKKTSYTNFIYLSVIVLLGTVIYSNSFDCTFHFDDLSSIVQNPKIRNLHDLQTIKSVAPSRFVAYYSFALNYHFGELNVWGYHFVNLVIHLINACLVYWLAVLILSCPALSKNPATNHKKAIAFFAALMFVSHPLATQSVTYIVQRLASLVTLFYLLSLAFYVKARLTTHSKKIKYLLFAGSVVAALLAFQTKENAYTLPGAVLLFEIFFLQTKRPSVNFKDYRLYLFGAVLIGAIAFVIMRFPSGIFKPVPPSTTYGNPYTITSMDYFYTQFSVILKYIQLLFLPVHQNLDYYYPLSHSFFEAKTLISSLVLVSLLGLAVYLFKKNRIISFGIFWFFLTLSIESSFIPLSDVIFEHRTYLPSFGFFLILSYVIYSRLWNKQRTLALSLFLLIIGSNSILTWQRNKTWLDDITLMTDCIEKSPEKARPWGSRGDAYYSRSEWQNALADYQQAVRINPNYSTAYNNIGVLYSQLNQLDSAVANYKRSLAADPKYAKAYYSIGTMYLKLGQWRNSIDNYSKAIGFDTTLTMVYYTRGTAYNQLQQWDSAITDLTWAINYKINKADLYFQRGYAYSNIDKWNETIGDYTKTIELDPNNKDGYYNRGNIYDMLKQWDKSIPDYTSAIAINPRFVQAYVNRGVAYGNIGRWDKSVEDYTSALAIDPNFRLAYTNREAALIRMRGGR